MRSLILGARGMVGDAIRRELLSRSEDFALDGSADLTLPASAGSALEAAEQRFGVPDVLYLCAARVGGIQRNITESGRMIYDNLMIQANAIEAARRSGVRLFVFLGSSCVYPRHSPASGWSESDLLSGPCDRSNEPYAIAKLAGIKMLEAYERQYGMQFLAPMLCNLYGPGDKYDPENSHFVPGMIRRFHEAKLAGASSVTLWGTGAPRREVMHVDDCARIIVDLVVCGARGMLNIGPGVDDTLANYAALVQRVTGFRGRIDWDTTRPDGVMSKLLDVTRMKSFGIEAPKIDALTGFASTYECFLRHQMTGIS